MTQGPLADRLEPWFAGWTERSTTEAGRIRREGAAGPMALHQYCPEGSSHVPLMDSLFGQPDGSAALTIHSFELDAARDPADVPWTEADLDHHGRAIGLGGTRWRMMLSEQGRDIRVFDRVSMTGLHITVGPVKWWEYGAPLLPFLYWSAAANGAVMAHAGTIGTGDAMGIVAGASGTGKTTTVLLGLRAGLASCGDDFVYLEPSADGARVQLVYRTVKTIPGSSILPQDALRTDWSGNKDVHWLPVHDRPAAATSGGLLARATLTTAWHLSERPMPRMATPMDLLVNLLPSTMFRVPGDEAHVAAVLRRIAASLAIVELPRDGDFPALANLLRAHSGSRAGERRSDADG